MTRFDQLWHIVYTTWEPGETFNTSDIYKISEENYLEIPEPTILREMQKLRDSGLIEFENNRGRYVRRLIDGESRGRPNISVQETVADSRAKALSAVIPDLSRPSSPVDSMDTVDVVDDICSILINSRDRTEVTALVKARLGHGQFREQLIHYWKACPISGLSVPILLRASHIKPWKDSTDKERLDVYNGILLSPNIDAAFDAGLFSFSKLGLVDLSPQLSALDADIIGVFSGTKVNFDAGHEAFLDYHRRHVFRT